MKNAVIYARYSSQGQNEQSIEGQIRICTEYAESQGYTVVRVYTDKARSGTNDHRPDFQKMIADAESGAFEQIIVYKFDRFARNRVDSIMYKAQLKKRYGIRVVSATEPVSDDEGGEFYEMFLEWNDEKYSQRLSKRVHDGLDTSVKNGTYCGGYLIYGYKLIDTDKRGNKGIIHRVAIDEEQAEIVRFIFTEYAHGTPKKEIADELNKRHVLYKGKPFTYRTFENRLSNRKYTGDCMHGKRVCTNTYPAIIDKATFAAVQKRLEKNKILAGANSAVEPYILTGKAFCGFCGDSMTAGGGTSHTGAKHYYYVCHSKRKGGCRKSSENKNTLEFTVANAVYEFLSRRENAEIVAQDTINYYEQRTCEDSLRSIEARIRHAKDEAEQLTNAFILARNDMLRANIERKMQEIEILIKDLSASKAQVELERGKKCTKEKIIDFIAEMLKCDPADKEYQKQLIDNLVYKVFVYDDHIITYLTFGNDKEIKEISLADNDKAIDELKVQPLSSLVPVIGVEPIRVISPPDFESGASANSTTPAKQFKCTSCADFCQAFFICYLNSHSVYRSYASSISRASVLSLSASSSGANTLIDDPKDNSFFTSPSVNGTSADATSFVPRSVTAFLPSQSIIASETVG